jgi:hypothetical protein
VMVDIAQVHATLVAALTWLVFALSTCVLRDVVSASAGPAPLGRQFNPSAGSPRQKDARIPVTLCDNAYKQRVFLSTHSDIFHPYLARSSVALSLGFSISICLGGAVVDL